MKLQKLNGEMAWAVVKNFINENNSFNSITSIRYDARVENNAIYYKGEERNNGEAENISKEDFINAFENIKGLEEINTNTIKTILPSSLYRKRTPFIGLLHSSSIIK